MSGIIALPLLLLVIALIILAPILALVDIRKRDLPGAWRVYWVVIIVLVPLIGTIAYALLAHRTFKN